MTIDHSETTVLVSGASGFLGAHCVRQLLEQGYRVRGTLRSLSLEPALRAALTNHSVPDGQLEFVVADLTSDDGWDEAAAGCEFVLHVAAPYPAIMPKDEDELIIPARDGTLRVLRAAARAGARRVVYTSSIVAVAYGHDDYTISLDESVWTNLGGNINAYTKSKTLAEKSAWEFMDSPSARNGMELSVINPGFILGPSVDGRSYSTSGEIVRSMIRREYPGCAKLQFWIVDVRDAAAAHVAAMTSDVTAGRRYLAVSEPMWMEEIALALKAHLESRGYRITTRALPDFAVKLAALVDAEMRNAVSSLGVEFRYSTERIRADLNWQARGAEETVKATADSLIEFGLV